MFYVLRIHNLNNFLLQLMLIYDAVQWEPLGFGFYSFPLEAMAVGWLLVTGELLVVFLYTFTMLVIAYQDGVRALSMCVQFVCLWC